MKIWSASVTPGVSLKKPLHYILIRLETDSYNVIILDRGGGWWIVVVKVQLSQDRVSIVDNDVSAANGNAVLVGLGMSMRVEYKCLHVGCFK